MKKVDYTDISLAMVNRQKAATGYQKGKNGSQLTDLGDVHHSTMPTNMETEKGARFSSIDVNFKRQIDMLKQNRAHSMIPDNETPQRGRNTGTLPHNDSIYQSEVNQSMNSGLGLTPKRMQFEQ